MSPLRMAPLAGATLILTVTHAFAGQSVTTLPSPSADVWMYPPGAAGFSPYAPSFGSPIATPDPDRLGYFFTIFDTAGVVLGDGEEVLALTLRIRLLNSSSFDPFEGYVYDDTYDAFTTYGDGAVDPDPGRPIELYATMLGGDLTLADWNEASTPVEGPDGYNAKPADFFNGGLRNIQNNVDEGFDASPLAIGTTDDLMNDDGLLRVMDLAELTFEVDLTQDAVARAHFTEDVLAGHVGLIVSSLHAAGEMGVGGDEVFPRWATKEAFGGLDASLDVTVGTPAVPCEGDLNADFVVDSTDLNIILANFGTMGPDGDVDGSGGVDSVDLNLLLAAFGDVCNP